MDVHCSAVYDSKDLEATQMPINDRLDKKIVAYIHHGILCSHKKWWVLVLCRNMDESGNHRSQPTDTRTENQTPHVLSWTMRTHGHREGSITHWSLSGGEDKGRTVWVGRLGTNNMGRNARYRWWGDAGSKPHCHVSTYATTLHNLHMYPRT